MSHAISTAVAPEGIDDDAVTAWFAVHVGAAHPPLTFSLLEAGHSNMTFVVTDTRRRRWVLRRPPLHTVLATAHDMGREHRAIAALHPEGFPVPRPLGLCTDPEVNGAPFYVMDYVDGLVVRDAGAAAALPQRTRRALSRSLVEVLAQLHSFDPDAVGLADHGRREGYVARQLRRWLRQVTDAGTVEHPEIRDVHEGPRVFPVRGRIHHHERFAVRPKPEVAAKARIAREGLEATADPGRLVEPVAKRSVPLGVHRCSRPATVIRDRPARTAIARPRPILSNSVRRLPPGSPPSR